MVIDTTNGYFHIGCSLCGHTTFKLVSSPDDSLSCENACCNGKNTVRDRYGAGGVKDLSDSV